MLLIDVIHRPGSRSGRNFMKFSHRILHYLKHSFFFVGLASIAWLIFRSGTKPVRAVYPCQQAAAATAYLWVATFIVLPLASLFSVRKYARPGKVAFLLAGLILTATVFSALYVLDGQVDAGLPGDGSGISGFDTGGQPYATNQFQYENGTESADAVISDLYVMKGKTRGNNPIPGLINLMKTNRLRFYQRSMTPAGLIGKNDVVVIKVNCQWSERGGTNTDLVKSLIRAILAHPDGFTGEIVVADNGQGRGSFTWANANAADKTQSVQKVIDSFAGSHRVSTYLWDDIRNAEVAEYSSGDMRSGYIVNHTANPRTLIHVSYPKFETGYGTQISMKYGIWEGGEYNNSRLKLINVPVLKSHGGAGVTASLKHYVGMLSVPKTDGLAARSHE
ncbi:MAG: DUF362 domain-containing protein, partial [Methanoregulaceae archaeon]|nr:DUF362 domain-containing protein [Methanoregulaceae archaeon]